MAHFLDAKLMIDLFRMAIFHSYDKLPEGILNTESPEAWKQDSRKKTWPPGRSQRRSLAASSRHSCDGRHNSTCWKVLSILSGMAYELEVQSLSKCWLQPKSFMIIYDHLCIHPHIPVTCENDSCLEYKRRDLCGPNLLIRGSNRQWKGSMEGRCGLQGP